ncbi:hypothetical protein ACFODL_21280 [Phenylobacterium terrae]|uniref:DUF3618 domain-containing protein n=1 Tax=Phenylobacterium terrae TaxID=2665495 RepID=A0ABW4N041_9CAUL
MKMREDELGRAALGWARQHPEDGRELAGPEAPPPKRKGAPLSGYGSADELYAAMGAARRANLARLAEDEPLAANTEADPRPASKAARIFGWSFLVGLAAVAAGSATRRVRRRSR